MKKKVVILIALVLLLSLTVGLLAGCNSFQLNKERDAKQIVATVNYEHQTTNVYKYELESSFNAYAYAYVNYYGMTWEAAADYLIKSLAQRELLVLFAKQEVATALNKGDAALVTIKELLSNCQYDHAIDETNKSLLSSLETIVSDNITDYNYNTGSSGSTSDKNDDDNVSPDAKTVYVRFNSNGGSAVDRQTLKEGQKATEPSAPTRSGYQFYGWYEDEAYASSEEFDDSHTEFNFKNTVINAGGISLYAKWVPTLAARTEKPKPEEKDDYDPEIEDKDFPESEISPQFFTDEYKATVYDEFKDKDFVKNIKVPQDSTLEETLRKYIDDGISELEGNLKKNLWVSSVQAAYDYTLENQMKTELISKLERLIGSGVSVTEQEVQAQFDRLVKQNKETFAYSDKSYSSALTSALATTYYHPGVENGSYGFVTNILLKLDTDSVNELVQLQKDGYSDAAVLNKRNELIGKMMINVSNPYYDSETVSDFDYGKDADGNAIKVKDPMTDPKNPYNKPNTEFNQDNDYNKIISFEYDEEAKSWAVKYNCKEATSMAYLLDKYPAFDQDGKTGIIHQIYNSLEQVKAAVTDVTDHKLSVMESVYWLREVANAWLYLVGDDSGAVTDSSNNNGLGYLVTPEGEESSYLKDFTSYARALISKGTGAYCTETVTDFASLAGNNKAYVVADSFIETHNTSNAYAGVFVLLAGDVVWDENAYTNKKEDGSSQDETKVDLDSDSKILPMNYIITYGKTAAECKTIRDQIYDALLAGKKSDAYNLQVNTFGLRYAETISYNAKAYKSLWKGKD